MLLQTSSVLIGIINFSISGEGLLDVHFWLALVHCLCGHL